MQIGVCYYPEHWPQSQWADDATRMIQMGISVVRIGEFAWSRIEPDDGQFELDWLDKAISILGTAGLEIVLGTPTATPPKWLTDKHRDIFAKDEHGMTRVFGSRRHYCFSSTSYKNECARIVNFLSAHYGKNEYIIAWQTDNEYGCHETILSYSDAALLGFRLWCKKRYDTIQNLNTLWGNVFWSMEYNSFDQIELPIGTVTEANPAHRMAFWRYSSDQVKCFNKIQTDILRKNSPGRDLIHNYMGNFTDFDHYAVGEDLDVASWDNYPLGFLDRDGKDIQDKINYLRTGHPDSSAFHHDLYRGVGNGRWWVMEQQPGPVNWAPHNPAPLDGMLRLWGLEAFAHGAEVISWFRWRQAPFAQEQMHAGLCLPNGELDTGGNEVGALAKELERLQSDIGNKTSDKITTSTPVALIFDYNCDQLSRILRFGGDAFEASQYAMQIYSACRRCGVNIDILPASADLHGYKVILLPNFCFSNTTLVNKLEALTSQIILFPGTGARTRECAIPEVLAPGDFRRLIDIKVTRSESLPDFVDLIATTESDTYTAQHWRERIDSTLIPEGQFDDGWGFHYSSCNVHYLNTVLTPTDLNKFMRKRLMEAGVAIVDCADGLRIRDYDNIRFAFNYGPTSAELSTKNDYLIGGHTLLPGEIAAWRK